jgi:hypothetical protein
MCAGGQPRDNAVANGDELKAWLQKNGTNARGFTIKTTDGATSPLYPPYHFGGDFVAGSWVEDRDEPSAYPYSGVVSIRLMATKARGF